MVIADTTVWIDFLAGKESAESLWLRGVIGRAEVALTDLILCEILQGVGREANFDQVRRILSRFPIFDTGGEELAVASAQNYRWLRSRGHTVRRTIDCIIATFCIRDGHSLLHHDRDFDPFEKHLGLQVIHPRIQLQ